MRGVPGMLSSGFLPGMPRARRAGSPLPDLLPGCPGRARPGFPGHAGPGLLPGQAAPALVWRCRAGMTADAGPRPPTMPAGGFWVHGR